MTARATRLRHNRRDRRKAKASGWKREGCANPSKVGHGGAGQGTFGYLGAVKEKKPETGPKVYSIGKFLRKMREARCG